MDRIRLVPHLDLCRRIPADYFDDSYFVWSYSCDKRDTRPFVEERDIIQTCRRDMVNAPDVFPAPTLSEILNFAHNDGIIFGGTTTEIIMQTGSADFALEKLIAIKWW